MNVSKLGPYAQAVELAEGVEGLRHYAVLLGFTGAEADVAVRTVISAYRELPHVLEVGKLCDIVGAALIEIAMER